MRYGRLRNCLKREIFRWLWNALAIVVVVYACLALAGFVPASMRNVVSWSFSVIVILAWLLRAQRHDSARLRQTSGGRNRRLQTAESSNDERNESAPFYPAPQNEPRMPVGMSGVVSSQASDAFFRVLPLFFRRARERERSRGR
jgi:hypothetical protein